MRIDKRLIGTVPESKKYVAGNVALQWCGLVANITLMTAIARFLAALFTGGMGQIGPTVLIAAVAVAVRYLCTVGASRMSFLSSKAVSLFAKGVMQ